MVDCAGIRASAPGQNCSRRVLFCNCSYSQIISDDAKREILGGLLASQLDLVVVPDLCQVAARRDPLLRELAQAEELAIVACYPRAVRWLFRWCDVELREEHVLILNMRVETPHQILTRLRDASPSTGQTLPSPDRPGAWVPWFPVIDYERCIACRQCLEFCLFDVYGEDDSGKVVVTNPERCKTNCPACARLCPEVAIIFPKADESPINGEDIVEDKLGEARVRLSLDDILGENVYATLAQRRALRQRQLSGSEGRMGE